MRTLCLGEALVDLVCERPVSSLAEAETFTRHFGGATANVAVHMARLGAPTVLASGAGDDPFGRWLRERLAEEGVDVSFFDLQPETPTPVALATVDPTGEPTYTFHGDGIASVVHSLAGRVDEAVAAADALFFVSDSLVDEDARTMTMRARERALAEGKPVLVDANFRLDRWRSRADAAATVNACVPDAFLLRANAAEAELLTGEPEPERAATALLKAGARLVLLSLGPEGAMLRGAMRADATGVPVEVKSTIGAGDALTGTLLGRLAQADFYPPVAAAALTDAVAASARACERWGAF
jgi:sugar/nucleoside kinase (ribokinase family)